MKIIYLEWLDAMSVEGWVLKGDLVPELATIKSVGFLLHECDVIITICVNFDETNSSYSCIMNIPKAWVKKQRVLGLGTETL